MFSSSTGSASPPGSASFRRAAVSMVRQRPVAAGLRSLLWPGWGQLYLGRRYTGWTLILFPVLLVAAALAVWLMLGTVELSARLSDSTVLKAVTALLLAAAAVRAVDVGTAVLSGDRLLPGLALVLMLLAAAPLFWAGYVSSSVSDTFDELFVADTGPHEAAAPTAKPLPAEESPLADESPPDNEAAPTNSSFPTSSGTGVDGVEPSSPTPTVQSVVPLLPQSQDPSASTRLAGSSAGPGLPDGRLNVLLLGSDAGPGRSGLRTDAMMLASIDVSSGDAVLVGLPRNFGGLSFSDGSGVPTSMLNAVYAWGEFNPNRVASLPTQLGSPGASALADVVGVVTGVTPQYFAMVDLVGFAPLIDAFGGVSMTVPKTVAAPLYDPVSGGYSMIEIAAGDHHFSGGEALAYSRVRKDSSDYVRMGRQRCVLSALASQAASADLVWRMPAVLDVVRDVVTTDLPLSLVPDLVRLAGRVDGSQIRLLGFDSSWSAGRSADGYHIPDVGRTRAAVAELLAGESLPPAAASAADACA